MAPDKPIYICYSFRFEDQRQIDFKLNIHPLRLELINPPRENLPGWTALAYNQCENCPLDPTLAPRCPLALNLVEIVKAMDGLLSFENVQLVAQVEARQITQDTTVQQAARSLMGLLIATSGCPHTRFFKPMARFHLPLSSTEETICRSISMYLLGQYFNKVDGQPADFDLQGLSKIYEDIRIINIHVADRLRSAIASDPAVNAIILLDIYSQSLPMVIEEYLDSIRYLYDAIKGHNRPL